MSEKGKIIVYADKNILKKIEKLLTKTDLGEYNYTIEIPLSTREVEILRLVTKGKSNTEIGINLNISPYTVKAYLNHIFDKLGVKDRICAAVKATKENLV